MKTMQESKFFYSNTGQKIVIPNLSENMETKFNYLNSIKFTEDTKHLVFTILPHLTQIDLRYWTTTLTKDELLFLYEHKEWAMICKYVYSKGLIKSFFDVFVMHRLGGYWYWDQVLYNWNKLTKRGK